MDFSDIEGDDFEEVVLHPSESLHVLIEDTKDGRKVLSFMARADVVDMNGVPDHWQDMPFNRVKGEVTCDPKDPRSAPAMAEHIADRIFNYRLSPDTRITCTLFLPDSMWRKLRLFLFGGSGVIESDAWTIELQSCLEKIAAASPASEVVVVS